MLGSVSASFEHHGEALSRRFDGRLRVIAKQAVTVWFNQDRLDLLLAGYAGLLEGCELIYAIDESGRQVSSNICSDSIDVSAYGQDLSRRPYAVRLTVLGSAAFHGAFSCGVHFSQVTQRHCETIMYGVTSGSSLLGFVAADFHLAFDRSAR